MQTPFSTVAEAVARIGEIFPDNGFTFQDDRGKETPYLFTDMERATAARVAGMQALGLTKGDRIGLVIVEPEQFVLTFLAALRCGVIPVPLYPPLSMGNLDAYADRTATILQSAGARVLVASGRLQNLLWSQVDKVDSLERVIVAEDLVGNPDAAVWPEIAPEDLAFLQYTSGSTSDPKGVIVTHANLVANANGILGPHALAMDPLKDIAVSWLPLYHDMGLIGFVISPVLWGINAVFIPTLRFIKKPTSWLDTMHAHRATISFAPNFAYALVARKAKPEQLAAWDLSSIKALGCGAEPINPDTMRAFTEVMHTRCGLPRTAMLPAYGMAEATLAIAFKPLAETMRTTVVDAAAFGERGRVEVRVEGEGDGPVLEHVSCGRWFPEHEVRIRAEDGSWLPEGHEGEICLQGPSVTPGYFENPEATAAAFADGWLRTGDLGYVLDGEVYVTGRIKDLIILNGRNLHPQSIEWIAAHVDGVRKGNVVAFSRPGGASEELVVVCETKLTDPTARAALVQDVKKAIQREQGVVPAEVVVIDAGLLPKTSSGKLQRRKTRQQYLTYGVGHEGSRIAGSSGSTLTVARHMAKGLLSRTKAALRK
ncbi:MAG: fatty acyl-AMP ligase [Alphaproteobacteria bacterium]|nr:fatty acyl-AMP ligase [Alphaproteobacteria bacterium]